MNVAIAFCRAQVQDAGSEGCRLGPTVAAAAFRIVFPLSNDDCFLTVQCLGRRQCATGWEEIGNAHWRCVGLRRPFIHGERCARLCTFVKGSLLVQQWSAAWLEFSRSVFHCVRAASCIDRDQIHLRLCSMAVQNL